MTTAFVRGNNLVVRASGVTTIGSPIVDLLVHVDEKFLQESALVKGSASQVNRQFLDSIIEKLRRPMKRSTGGTSLSIAFHLALLSHSRIAFMGKVGVDYEGWFCRREMREAKVASWIFVDQQIETSRVLSLVTPDGQRTMLASLQACQTIDVDEFAGYEFRNMGFVHFEGYLIAYKSFCQRAMGLAKGHGASISFSLPLLRALKEHEVALNLLIDTYVDLLFANYEEASYLTQQLDPPKICLMMGQRVKCFFLNCQAEGLWCLIEGVIYHYCAPILEKPFDQTGASAAFCAGFLHGIRWGWPVQESLAFTADLIQEVIKTDGARLSQEGYSRLFEKYKRLFLPISC